MNQWEYAIMSFDELKFIIPSGLAWFERFGDAKPGYVWRPASANPSKEVLLVYRQVKHLKVHFMDKLHFATLSHLGQAGWEVYAIAQREDLDPAVDNTIYYLKRQIGA